MVEKYLGWLRVDFLFEFLLPNAPDGTVKAIQIIAYVYFTCFLWFRLTILRKVVVDWPKRTNWLRDCWVVTMLGVVPAVLLCLIGATLAYFDTSKILSDDATATNSTDLGNAYDDKYQPRSGFFDGWLIRADPSSPCELPETNTFLAFGIVFTILTCLVCSCGTCLILVLDSHLYFFTGLRSLLCTLACTFLALVFFSAWGECENGETMTTYHDYPTPAPSLSPTLAPTLTDRVMNGSSVGEDGSGSSLTVLDCGAQCVVGTWLAGLGVFIFGVPSLWMFCVVWFRHRTCQFVDITSAKDDQKAAFNELVAQGEGQVLLFFIVCAFTPTISAIFKPVGSVILALHSSNVGYWGLFASIIWMPASLGGLFCLMPERKESGRSYYAGRLVLLLAVPLTPMVAIIPVYGLDESRPDLASFFFLGQLPLALILTVAQPVCLYLLADSENERQKAAKASWLSELVAPFEGPYWWFKSWLLIEQVGGLRCAHVCDVRRLSSPSCPATPLQGGFRGDAHFVAERRQPAP